MIEMTYPIPDGPKILYGIGQHESFTISCTAFFVLYLTNQMSNIILIPSIPSIQIKLVDLYHYLLALASIDACVVVPFLFLHEMCGMVFL